MSLPQDKKWINVRQWEQYLLFCNIGESSGTAGFGMGICKLSELREGRWKGAMMWWGRELNSFISEMHKKKREDGGKNFGKISGKT